MKKFKTKKKKRKILPYIIIIILVYLFTTKVLMNISLKSSNEEFIKEMLNNSNHYQKYEQKNYLDIFIKNILNINIKNPKLILESVFKFILLCIFVLLILNSLLNIIYLIILLSCAHTLRYIFILDKKEINSVLLIE